MKIGHVSLLGVEYKKWMLLEKSYQSSWNNLGDITSLPTKEHGSSKSYGKDWTLGSGSVCRALSTGGR